MVKKLEIDALFFIIVGAFFGLFFISYVKSQPLQFHSNAANPIQAMIPHSSSIQTVPLTPTPTIAFVPTITTTSQISSDGTQKVVLKTISNRDLSKTYEVSTGDNGPVFYTTILGPTENISLPYNAWEPENRYFFIQENLTSGPKILVFKADGTPFDDGTPYLNLTDAYAKLGSSYTFDAATGWAGYNLIVINTKQVDKTQGPSYWYELPSGSLIELATKF